MLEQLPMDRQNPGPIFWNMGVDYAGPMLIKFGSIEKPVFAKAYVYMCFTVKAVHLELVSNLITLVKIYISTR